MFWFSVIIFVLTVGKA